MTKKANTKILVIVSILFVFIFIANVFLSKTSKTYNEMIDKNNYNQLCSILKSENIKQIIVTRPNEPANYITDYNVFGKMYFKQSAWNVKSYKWNYRIGVVLKNSPSEIVFASEGTELFSTSYQNRRFIVSLPLLIDHIKKLYQ